MGGGGEEGWEGEQTSPNTTTPTTLTSRQKLVYERINHTRRGTRMNRYSPRTRDKATNYLIRFSEVWRVYSYNGRKSQNSKAIVHLARGFEPIIENLKLVVSPATFEGSRKTTRLFLNSITKHQPRTKRNSLPATVTYERSSSTGLHTYTIYFHARKHSKHQVEFSGPKLVLPVQKKDPKSLPLIRATTPKQKQAFFISNIVILVEYTIVVLSSMNSQRKPKTSKSFIRDHGSLPRPNRSSSSKAPQTPVVVEASKKEFVFVEEEALVALTPVERRAFRMAPIYVKTVVPTYREPANTRRNSIDFNHYEDLFRQVCIYDLSRTASELC